ncbi:hypothetical protein M0J40_RS10210 [Providencia rettgeri]|uniref:hypothetical protein n=1 Tax=Providencia huaxiensis TaxID=2027290 RepID=UPI000C7EB526|nr:hypothetical protein [Providencia huaxiensis]EJD6042999.1 hypothetical protein [Providencia rettgeri]AXH61582.1 hypothetical protein CYG50_05820 [Providencia huaxiensis]ELR5124542.1 hypothetical protein [Providencia rettgeri]ELR5245260.1 hypothetical protein [Providencia rettgeri]ELS4582733.1 hypothetical protein [Providencia rettgeri]
MSIADIIPGYDSLKKVISTVKGAIDTKEALSIMKVESDIYPQLIQLQSQVLTAHQLYEAILSQKNAVERELIELKNHLIKLEDYELHTFSSGSTVFKLKPSQAGTQPLHYLCPHCNHEHIASILQPGQPETFHHTLQCPRCKTTFLTEKINSTPRVRTNPRKDGAW